MWLPLGAQTNVRSRNGTCQHTLHLPAYFATKDKFSMNSWEATHRSRESLGHRFYSNVIRKERRTKEREMPALHETKILQAEKNYPPQWASIHVSVTTEMPKRIQQKLRADFGWEVHWAILWPKLRRSDMPIKKRKCKWDHRMVHDELTAPLPNWKNQHWRSNNRS